MNALDVERIGQLARSLQAHPRHVLIAAARLARLHEHGAVDTAQRHSLVQASRRSLRAAEAAAALLRTPIASYAQDDVDRALASLWPAEG